MCYSNRYFNINVSIYYTLFITTYTILEWYYVFTTKGTNTFIRSYAFRACPTSLSRYTYFTSIYPNSH